MVWQLPLSILRTLAKSAINAGCLAIVMALNLVVLRVLIMIVLIAMPL